LAERLEAMKELVPEALSEGKIDFEKLRVALGEAVDDSPERYSFTWAGKMETRHEAAAVSVLDSE
jgi:adenine-specific DNA-methyltransferase